MLRCSVYCLLSLILYGGSLSSLSCSGRKKKGLRRRVAGAAPVFAELIRRSRCVKYGSLLAKHCPVGTSKLPHVRRPAVAQGGYASQEEERSSDTSLDGMGESLGGEDSGGETEVEGEWREEEANGCGGVGAAVADGAGGSSDAVLQDAASLQHKFASLGTRAGDVESFLRAALCSLFPPSMWGTKRNRELFIKGASRFLRLRKHEQLSVQCIRQGMKVTDIRWLHRGRSPCDLQLSTILLDRLICWCFTTVVMPLVRSLFYCTECEGTFHRIHFFRRPVWSAFSMSTVSCQWSIYMRLA
ncbi:unnamed protein product [Chrysoparadoxa australica]